MNQQTALPNKIHQQNCAWYMKVLVLVTIAVLTACQTTPETQDTPPEAEIIPLLPTLIEGYRYQGAYIYPRREYGYSFRYQLSLLNYADIYIYPVPESLKQQGHRRIVLGMTQNAIGEIRVAEAKGMYVGFKVLKETVFDSDGYVLSKVESRFIRENLESYSLIYLTERNNKLIKARITMPDNESNRVDQTWDEFVHELFEFIIFNIEKA